jgi:thymidylate synthase (FAD)
VEELATRLLLFWFNNEGTGDSLDAWNESSRRYITEEPVFYTPKADEWRSKPENSKQGSGDIIFWELGEKHTQELFAYIELGIKKYEQAWNLC